jgi:surface polysaccharide O-acyltransferase-like enzyme
MNPNIRISGKKPEGRRIMERKLSYILRVAALWLMTVVMFIFIVAEGMLREYPQEYVVAFYILSSVVLLASAALLLYNFRNLRR